MKRGKIEEGLLTTSDVARIYSVSRYDVYKMIKLQEVQTYNLVGHNRVFLKESEIKAAMPAVYKRINEREAKDEAKNKAKWEANTEKLLEELRSNYKRGFKGL